MGKKLSKKEFFARLDMQGSFIYRMSSLTSTNESYAEYAYEYLQTKAIECVDGEYRLKGVDCISRENTYAYEHATTPDGESNRLEELFVYDMFANGTDKNGVFGKLLAYQVPLNNTRADHLGKIDFVYEKNGCLYLAEIKSAESKESIFKAILEVQTYYQLIDKEKLLRDMKRTAGTKIRKAVVIFEETNGYKQFCENKKLQTIAKMFEVEIVVLDRKTPFSQVGIE